MCDTELKLKINFLAQLGEMFAGNVYMKNKEGIYLYHNNYMLTALKRDNIIDKSVKSFVGKSDYDLFPKKVADKFYNNDNAIIESNNECRFEEIVELKKNIKRKFISYKKPLYDIDNNACGVIGYSVEFTKLNINNVYVSLSRREMQTLAGIYNGMTIKEIAIRLNLSQRTVEDYFSSLKMKLQCNTKNKIVELIHRLDLSPVLSYFYNNEYIND